jgi:hypothetical protein
VSPRGDTDKTPEKHSDKRAASASDAPETRSAANASTGESVAPDSVAPDAIRLPAAGRAGA